MGSEMCIRDRCSGFRSPPSLSGRLQKRLLAGRHPSKKPGCEITVVTTYRCRHPADVPRETFPRWSSTTSMFHVKHWSNGDRDAPSGIHEAASLINKRWPLPGQPTTRSLRPLRSHEYRIDDRMVRVSRETSSGPARWRVGMFHVKRFADSGHTFLSRFLGVSCFT